MELWIARDKTGLLTLHEIEPYHKPIMGWSHILSLLNRELFPEVTFENSPQKVEIRLLNDDLPK
jgi:hypothetical protein